MAQSAAIIYSRGPLKCIRKGYFAITQLAEMSAKRITLASAISLLGK